MPMRTSRKRKTIRRRKPTSRVSKRRRTTDTFAKRVKRVLMKTCEPKTKTANFGKVEMYHNCFYNGGGVTLTGNVCHLNASALMPAGGTLDSQRIGDQIYMSHFRLKMLIGQKGDRPNVNFRYLILSVPKGSPIVYGDWFINTTGNILLDDPNKDFVKVIKQGTWRPNQAGLSATGNDEFTFAKRLSVPYKKLLKFGPADGAVTHNDNDLYFVLMAYDAYGTPTSDNIAYCHMSLEIGYRDP